MIFIMHFPDDVSLESARTIREITIRATLTVPMKLRLQSIQNYVIKSYIPLLMQFFAFENC